HRGRLVQYTFGARNVLLHRNHHRRRRAFGGALDGRDLQRQRRLVEFAERDLAEDQRARRARRQPLVVRRADRQAPVGFAPDQAVVLEQADAFAHGRAVDAELLDQFRLGTDRLARADVARQYSQLDRFGDEAIGRRGADAAEFFGEARQSRESSLTAKTYRPTIGHDTQQFARGAD